MFSPTNMKNIKLPQNFLLYSVELYLSPHSEPFGRWFARQDVSAPLPAGLFKSQQANIHQLGLIVPSWRTASTSCQKEEGRGWGLRKPFKTQSLNKQAHRKSYLHSAT